jgi:hypothetical protein
MLSDVGLWIGGRGVSDEFEGKTDKQGEYDCIIETKLGLQARSQCVPLPALHAPYIGGQVTAWLSMIQIHSLGGFTT